MTQNKALIFAEIPSGLPEPGVHLKIEDRTIDLQATEPADHGLLVKNHYLSFDPYQRGRMRSPDIKSYSAPYEVGKPIVNSSISSVVKSGHPKFKAGDVVECFMSCPTEEYSLLPAETVDKTVKKLDNPYSLNPKYFIGVLGMPGLTAYTSFFDIGQPKEGETIFVSAASGAVGAMVGQLAKRQGLKVIGSVGDDKKLEYIINELKFDGGFNYKKEKPSEALQRLAPNGLDIYYENVGGEHLEAAVGAMNNHGRIVACGMVSQYNTPPKEQFGVKNLMNIVAKRLKIQGFIIGDYLGTKWPQEHQKNVQLWLRDGSIKAIMSETQGIENAAEGFVGMLQGKNFGKSILVVSKL